MDENSRSDFEKLNAEARRIWDTNAEWWDDKIGDGNDFQRELIEPATERLLHLNPGEAVLDIGCGAGRLARRMAELGAHVVAFDFSDRFIKQARERTGPDVGNIEYHVADATDERQVCAFGAKRFDAAVASMALMDMTTIGPLMTALGSVLKPAGRFVFSVMHPCFQPPEVCKFTEQVENEGRIATRSGVKMTEYLTPATWKGLGIVGQPEPQYYFHRPLSVLLNAGFQAGFVVDGIEEPAFKKGDAAPGGVRWNDMPEIPPVLVVRMRLPAKSL